MNITLNPSAFSSRAGDQIVVTTSKGNESIVLNPVGSWLWEQIEILANPSLSCKKLVQKLVDAYDGVSEERAEEDVRRFIEKLVTHDLVSIED